MGREQQRDTGPAGIFHLLGKWDVPHRPYPGAAWGRRSFLAWLPFAGRDVPSGWRREQGDVQGLVWRACPGPGVGLKSFSSSEGWSEELLQVQGLVWRASPETGGVGKRAAGWWRRVFKAGWGGRRVASPCTRIIARAETKLWHLHGNWGAPLPPPHSLGYNWAWRLPGEMFIQAQIPAPQRKTGEGDDVWLLWMASGEKREEEEAIAINTLPSSWEGTWEKARAGKVIHSWHGPGWETTGTQRLWVSGWFLGVLAYPRAWGHEADCGQWHPTSGCPSRRRSCLKGSREFVCVCRQCLWPVDL